MQLMWHKIKKKEKIFKYTFILSTFIWKQQTEREWSFVDLEESNHSFHIPGYLCENGAALNIASVQECYNPS